MISDFNSRPASNQSDMRSRGCNLEKNRDGAEEEQQHTRSDLREKKKQFQLFFGGSCNPTTWRRDIATPFLESKQISYYNPQVDDWTPDLVEKERDAKQNATILLFVIDRQTRSTVSILESAFMAGKNRELVMVMVPFQHNDYVDGCVCQSRDQTSGHDDLAQLKSNQEATNNSKVVKICDEIVSPRELAELGQARQLLHCLLALRKIPNFLDIPSALEYIDQRLNHHHQESANQSKDVGNEIVDEDEIKRRDSDKRKLNQIYLYHDETEEKFIASSVKTSLDQQDQVNLNPITIDTFLRDISLDHGSLNSLDEARLITRLRDHMSNLTSHALHLFVITKHSRAILTMLFASHFLALDPKRVVLAIENVTIDCPIEGSILSKGAVADYNRGRLYLRDYANQSQTPVYDSLGEALAHCENRIKRNFRMPEVTT